MSFNLKYSFQFKKLISDDI